MKPMHCPHGFDVDDHELLIGGQRVSHLALRVGQTPFYAFDRQKIRTKIQQLKAALPPTIHLHYAIKANPFPALVHFVAPHVDGLDVASGQELQVALDTGVSPTHISFAGPGKTEKEIVQGVAAGIVINVESWRDLDIAKSAAKITGIKARLALRINPDFELKSSGMKMSGGPKPFGIDAESAPEILQGMRHESIQFEGFHVYCGSQNLKEESIVEAQFKAYELIKKLSQDAPTPPRILNIGGGLGIPYFPGENRLNIEPIANHLRALESRRQIDFPDAFLVLELGRYLVGEAGVYLCKVLDRKVSRGQIFLVTDGGLHHHLAASGNFGQVIRKNYPVLVATKMHGQNPENVSVVGPLCTPLDILGDRIDLPFAEPGDLIAVMVSGAYGASASPQNFLSHPHVKEILV